MLEDPFHYEDAPQQRPLILAWWIWFGSIACAIGVAVWASGCASAPVPECPTWEYSIVEDGNGDKWMLLDAENAMKLGATLNGLARGKCRPPPSDKET